MTGIRDVHVTGEDQEHYDVPREIHEPLKWEFSTSKFEHTWFSVGTKAFSTETSALTLAVEEVEAKIIAAHKLNKGIEERLDGINQKIK